MKTKFKKNYLSLAIISMLLVVTNSSGAKNVDVSVDSVNTLRNPALTPATATRLVSANRTGTASGNQYSDSPVLSANGQFIAFFSYANDLVENDANGTSDVFVRDLKTGTTTLASINNAKTASGNGSSFGPVLSADGRLLAFYSDASDLVANDTNGTVDVFVRDLETGTTTLASVNSSGMSSGNRESFSPVLSANGQFVAFHSFANDLVANDINGTADVFVRDIKAGVTSLVSINSSGTASGNAPPPSPPYLPPPLNSYSPVLSANGQFVAFTSYASDLVANDTNDSADLFVRNLKTGTTTLAFVNSAATAIGDAISFGQVLSADGRLLAFYSNASDLVANDINGTVDVFVRDLKTGTTTLASVNSSGMSSGNQESFSPVLSANGRFVAFHSFANDLVANDINGTTIDVFVRDLKTGSTTLASVNSAGTASGNSSSFSPVLSADGRFVAFHSYASDLVANDINGTTIDVFVRDLKTGITTLASVNSAGTATGNDSSDGPLLSTDGRFLAFRSYASDLVANDTNGTADLFVRPTAYQK